MLSEDERALAALAHAGMIANVVSGGGIVAAAVIWATQRQRSGFVALHALQALLFQGLGLLLTLLGALVWGGCMGLSLLPLLLRPDLYEQGPPGPFWVALLGGMLLLTGFVLSGVLYALIGAWAAWRGQPFRYALVGRLLQRAPLAAPAAQANTTTPITGPLDPAMLPPLVPPPPADAAEADASSAPDAARAASDDQATPNN